MSKTTLQFILINPNKIELKTIVEATKDLPVRIILSYEIEDLKVIDSHIPVKRK